MSIVADARIRGTQSQQTFDVLLRALAEPGRPFALPRSVLHPDIQTSLWLPLSLADVDVSVSVDDDPGHRDAALIRDATGARIANLSSAQIAVLSEPSVEQIAQLPIGDAMSPEDGARLALLVDQLLPRAGGLPLRIQVSGPGVPGKREFWVSGLSAKVLRRLGSNSGSFPAGIDTWLFTHTGTVIAIARTTDLHIEGK